MMELEILEIKPTSGNISSSKETRGYLPVPVIEIGTFLHKYTFLKKLHKYIITFKLHKYILHKYTFNVYLHIYIKVHYYFT